MKKPIEAQPGSQNKTGSWRNTHPVFDHEKCIACGKCESVCPEGCVFRVGEKVLQGKMFYECDLDYCKGCGLCAAECPVKCIKMVPEEK